MTIFLIFLAWTLAAAAIVLLQRMEAKRRSSQRLFSSAAGPAGEAGHDLLACRPRIDALRRLARRIEVSSISIAMPLPVKRMVTGWLLLAGLVAGAHAADQGSPVVLSEDADTATLANGMVSATVKKANGNLVSLRFRDVELMSRGGGYWNIYGSIPGQKSTDLKPTPSVFRISRNPAENGGALGEIALGFPYRGQPKAVPLDIEIRYTLRRGDSGLYGWTIADHNPHYPPLDIEASTVCLKLNPGVFDFLSVDGRRQRQMASGEDWVQGTRLNLPCN